MSVTVRIPTAMRPLTGGASTVEVAGSTVKEVLEALIEAHPGTRERLFDDAGKLRRFVNIYVEEEDIRLATPKTAARKNDSRQPTLRAKMLGSSRTTDRQAPIAVPIQ